MKNTLELRRLIPVKDNQKSRKRRTKMISTFLMSREFKSKSTVNNKSLRIKILQILSKNFVKVDLEFVKILAQASNQSDLDLRLDEKAIQIQVDC